jgi:hypothetical protein
MPIICGIVCEMPDKFVVHYSSNSKSICFLTDDCKYIMLGNDKESSVYKYWLPCDKGTFTNIVIVIAKLLNKKIEKRRIQSRSDISYLLY